MMTTIIFQLKIIFVSSSYHCFVLKNMYHRIYLDDQSFPHQFHISLHKKLRCHNRHENGWAPNRFDVLCIRKGRLISIFSSDEVLTGYSNKVCSHLRIISYVKSRSICGRNVMHSWLMLTMRHKKLKPSRASSKFATFPMSSPKTFQGFIPSAKLNPIPTWSSELPL